MMNASGKARTVVRARRIEPREHRPPTSRRRTLAQDEQQAARDESARFTAVRTEATATLHRIDDGWCLCIAWSDATADVAALTDAWSAREALVLADLALHERREARAELTGAAVGR